MKKIVLLFLATVALTQSCSRVAITGRNQGRLLPESEMMAMGLTQYQSFLKENKLSSSQEQTQMVKTVGENIKKAVERYYGKIGKSEELKGYNWEFNLVESPDVNAWCMPGGKVVVYTGIMPVVKDADGLAIVLGHEISHALAHHGNERMSQALLAQAGGLALSVALANKPQETQNMFMQAYGIGAQVGALLPFSRMQESEADKMGLYFSTMAGYDPNIAAPFWERMSAASKGNRPPAFLSTHPDPAKRAETLKELVPQAQAYAEKYK